MIWLTGIGCLALGVVLGVIFSKRSGANNTRIKELESQIIAIEERHEQYKGDVSEHFGVTSELVQQMTQSYRDVYQHLAMGAQDLCTTEVANKMLPVGADAVFDAAAPKEEALGFTPPKDYAAKADPDQKGALAEDFGLQKTRPEEPALAGTVAESADKSSPESGAETASDKPASTPESESESVTEPAPEPESAQGTESEAEADSDRRFVSATEHSAEEESDTERKPESRSEPDSDDGSDSESEAEFDADSESESEPDAASIPASEEKKDKVPS